MKTCVVLEKMEEHLNQHFPNSKTFNMYVSLIITSWTCISFLQNIGSSKIHFSSTVPMFRKVFAKCKHKKCLGSNRKMFQVSTKSESWYVFLEELRWTTFELHIWYLLRVEPTWMTNTCLEFQTALAHFKCICFQEPTICF